MPAGLLRRLGAVIYDSVIVMGLLVVPGLLMLPFMDGALLTPAESGTIAYAFRALQLLLIVLFFGYFWTRRGQTIGMLAWRLHITRSDGAIPSWGDSLKRLAILAVLLVPPFVGDALWFSTLAEPRWRTLARCLSWLPMAACYLWLYIDRERLTWHDRWSRTRIWAMPKASSGAARG